MEASIPAPPKYTQEKIRSLVEEAKKLTMSNLRDDVVTLRALLSSTTLTGQDTFQVPSGRVFLIREIRAHLALQTPGTEVLGVGGMQSSFMFQDRVAAKALQARVQLVNQDRSDLKVIESDIGTNNTLCLASLLPVCGGAPIYFGEEFPLIVPPIETLRLDVTLTDATTAGLATEYGLTLIGSMVAISG